MVITDFVDSGSFPPDYVGMMFRINDHSDSETSELLCVCVCVCVTNHMQCQEYIIKRGRECQTVRMRESYVTSCLDACNDLV